LSSDSNGCESGEDDSGELHIDFGVDFVLSSGIDIMFGKVLR